MLNDVCDICKDNYDILKITEYKANYGRSNDNDKLTCILKLVLQLSNTTVKIDV